MQGITVSLNINKRQSEYFTRAVGAAARRRLTWRRDRRFAGTRRGRRGEACCSRKGRVCALSGKRERKKKKKKLFECIKSGYMLLFSPTLDWFENDGTSQLFITEIGWGEDVNRSGVAHEWRQDRSTAGSILTKGQFISLLSRRVQ